MKKISKLSFVTLLALSTYACNGSKSTDDADASNAGADSNDTSPQIIGKMPSKIDFEIPAAIKVDNSKSKRQGKKVRDNKQSGAFKLLKEKISETDTFSGDIKIQFVLIDAVISDIQDKCESIAITDECTIPSNQISFNLDNTVINKLIEIDETKGNEFASKYESKPYQFSEINYTAFSDTDDYQYRVKTTNTNDALFTLNWSKDLSLMNALYSNTSDSAEENSNYSHTYEVNNQVETITLVNSNDIYDFELSLSKLNDEKDTYTLTSSYDYTAPTAIDGYTSTTYIGEIDSIKGSLESSQYVNNYELFNRSVEYFDTQGKVDSSIFCDDLHMDVCSYDDQSTWIDYTYAVAYVDNISLEVVNTELENNSEFPGDANYFLFPSATKLEDLTNENIKELSVGGFHVVFSGEFGNGERLFQDGVLHDLDYIDRLNELDIYVVDPMAETSIYKIDSSNLIITVSE